MFFKQNATELRQLRIFLEVSYRANEFASYETSKKCDREQIYIASYATSACVNGIMLWEDNESVLILLEI